MAEPSRRRVRDVLGRDAALRALIINSEGEITGDPDAGPHLPITLRDACAQPASVCMRAITLNHDVDLRSVLHKRWHDARMLRIKCLLPRRLMTR